MIAGDYSFSANAFVTFTPQFIQSDTNPDWIYDAPWKPKPEPEPTVDWSDFVFSNPPSGDKRITTPRDLGWYHRQSVVNTILRDAVRRFPEPRPVKMLIRRRAYIGRRGRDI